MAQITLSEDGLKELLITVVQEARKPPIDPLAERKKERARKQLKAAQDEMMATAISKARNCSHLREDMTSAIAWATQSDGITRGPCQHCDTLFSPVLEECAARYGEHAEEIHKMYSQLRRIPTQKGAVHFVNA